MKVRAMETISITPERKAQLDAYARRHGQDSAAALEDVLADYLGWEQQDYEEALEGIRHRWQRLSTPAGKPGMACSV
jgi:predicted transcriptional regulator